MRGKSVVAAIDIGDENYMHRTADNSSSMNIRRMRKMCGGMPQRQPSQASVSASAPHLPEGAKATRPSRFLEMNMSRISSFIASVIIAAAGLTMVFAGAPLGIDMVDSPLVRLAVLIMIGCPLIWLTTTLLAYGFTPSAKPAEPHPLLMRAPRFGSESRVNSANFSIGIR
jgi:hypothetical protein